MNTTDAYNLTTALTSRELSRLARFVREIERLGLSGLGGARVVRGLVRSALDQAELRSTAENVAMLRRATGGR